MADRHKTLLGHDPETGARLSDPHTGHIGHAPHGDLIAASIARGEPVTPADVVEQAPAPKKSKKKKDKPAVDEKPAEEDEPADDEATDDSE